MASLTDIQALDSIAAVLTQLYEQQQILSANLITAINELKDAQTASLQTLHVDLAELKLHREYWHQLSRVRGERFNNTIDSAAEFADDVATLANQSTEYQQLTDLKEASITNTINELQP